MENQKRIKLKDLNDVITCSLCEGYFVDATTVVECLHTFCRGCILRYFENSKTLCPTCNTVYKKKSSCLRPDTQIQTLVYKLVPSLYIKEMQRREDFYRSTGVRASSSCSDDSVLERERDTMIEQDEMISSFVGDKTQFYSPEDLLSLSLEYYQHHLDTTDLKNEIKPKENDISKNSDGDKKKECDKRYLQCPAGVTMRHLQKFVRMKYGLTADHRVDIIYKGEVLSSTFSLMDVAYTFKWEKKKPMRFFYRIFTPMKIQPIKIVNTTLSTGGKQLQIVPVKPSSDVPKPEKVEKKEELTQEQINQDQKEKERLLAHLQLQCKNKVQSVEPKPPPQPVEEKLPIKDYIFEYETPDPEAVKRFAEKRDREWALQKKLEEETRQEEEYSHHFSKKRKKSKHSKNEFNPHKKRKLHAEITSNEKEDLKLKVKITTNGHKHKHHKNNSEALEKTEVSSKEKLLQMRQVRHKHQPEEKDKNALLPVLKLSKDTTTTNETLKIFEKPQENNEDPNKNKEEKKEPIKPTEVEPNHLNEANTSKITIPLNRTNIPRPDLATKQTEKWGNKVPTVQLERNEQTEKQAQRTFKSFAEKYQKNELKTNKPKIENNKTPQPVNRVNNTINTNNKSLDRKIASLQQRCTIEPKNSTQTKPMMQYVKPTNDLQQKKVSFQNEKPKMITPTYPPGFTVSKIEAGAKRKNEEPDKIQDKRPSLEITLINPPSGSPQGSKTTETKPVAKRPPPATIPLERIKKSVSLKSGISIIPKQPERCDNIGALDLSKPSKVPTEVKPSKEPLNGINKLSVSSPRAPSNTPEKIGLSNLQMLSKVATEHSSINKPTTNNNIPTKQMPNLQTISRVPPSLQRMPPPKLNELQRQFRGATTQIRNLRPNQNQNIRNIPNPSLLVNRQQQNQRLVAPVNVQQSKTDAAKPEVQSKEAEQKAPEKKEVSV